MQQSETERAIAVLARALAVCRGALYLALAEDASQGRIKRLLDSTSQNSLVALMGQDIYNRVMHLAEALPQEDVDRLLSIGDDPY
jgi:hypothetical protein